MPSSRATRLYDQRVSMPLSHLGDPTTAAPSIPMTRPPLQEGGSWDEAAFYFWTYDRPTSMWYYVGTVALPVLVVACCLFPLAPW